jgi:uncharacterized protein (TIGR03790 family)
MQSQEMGVVGICPRRPRIGLGGLCLMAAALLASALPARAVPERPMVFRTGLEADELAIIVNDEDARSIAVASYYAQRRGIPAQNVIHVRFAPGAAVMSETEFTRIKAVVDAATPARIQAYALAWTEPYRAGCMSITTAFAAGYDKAYCAEGCAPTKVSPYFDSATLTPYLTYNLRPTMMLAGANVDEVMRLIDRGVEADGTAPGGTGYLVETDDKSRNVRAAVYDEVIRLLSPQVRLQWIKANFIQNRPDVLFYFTGAAHVPKIGTNHFLPGAMADHLTSSGGVLLDNRAQMSSLRWLQAGATGSYGTVVEPCNFPQKFPHPGVAIEHYLRGETLLEAYWKSVAMPGQGVFIGEPLARPFGRMVR